MESELSQRKTITAGQRYSRWTVLGIDQSSRRASCLCDCGNVRQVTFAALAAGQSRDCGCQPLPRGEFDAFRRERSERARRLPNWRPQR